MAGRPRKEIDKKDFESLCLIQCTLDEITAFFDNKLGGCSKDTIERWCKREYKCDFADISVKKRNLGKISLRRKQWEVAQKGNVRMLIHLGENVLGQGMSEQEKTNEKDALDKLCDAIQGAVKDE